MPLLDTLLIFFHEFLILFNDSDDYGFTRIEGKLDY
jgi:hypothetical protein